MYRMPKIPANQHPLRIVRGALGWTQQKLADKCGIAEISIRRIEGRTLKPSLDLIGRIMWVTGVDPESLDLGPPTLTGQPYSAELANAHVAGMRTKSQRGELEITESLGNHAAELSEAFMMVLLSAANKNAFHTVGFLFESWAKGIIEDFKLGPEFLKVSASPGSKLEKLQRAVKSRKKVKSKL